MARSRIEPPDPEVENSLKDDPRKVSMPHYEFFCQKCKKFFDKILSLVDNEEGEVLCPHCGSKKVEQRWSPFSAITSKKSA